MKLIEETRLRHRISLVASSSMPSNLIRFSFLFEPKDTNAEEAPDGGNIASPADRKATLQFIYRTFVGVTVPVACIRLCALKNKEVDEENRFASGSARVQFLIIN